MASEDKIKSFVRGETSWRDLGVPGIAIERSVDGAWTVRCKAGSDGASPSIQDIARGAVRLWSDPDELRSWATVLLAAGFVSLDEAETDDAWEELLNYLWDVTGGERPRGLYSLAVRLLDD